MREHGETWSMMSAPPEFRGAEQAVEIWLRLDLSRDFGDTLRAPLPREFEMLIDAWPEDS